ncbi:transglutaminase domain-containing protein [Lysinibacillus sp. NPDC096418]|uniref:transglutaminase domain-containing protein n=1 Tax=Lysinibacillus sp. NPDC096418 TaxID=3364138 RepID=UPI003826F191
MRKALFLPLLSLTLILSACSDAVVVPQKKYEVEEQKQPESKKISPSLPTANLFSTTLFDEDPALLQFTKDVEKHIAKFEKTFEVMYTGTLEWADFEVQLNDLPSLLSYVDPYTAGYFLQYEWASEETNKGFIIELTITYLTDAIKETAVNTHIESFKSTFITENMSDFERAKIINDYVVQLATYTDKGVTEGQTVYELITDETAVCQAYALLTYRLFKAAGLETEYVYGYSGDQLHAWNLVKVDDAWYHVDTTWNDAEANEQYAISYEYFLLNDTQLSNDHYWVTENYKAATGNAFTFMHDMWYADTLDDVIYYNSISDATVYAYNLSNNTNKQITETACYYLAVNDKSIYCSDYDNAGYLTKIYIEDGSEEVLLEEEVLNLFINNGTLYYETIDGEAHEESL